MEMGRGGSKGWSLRPHSAWFYLTPSLPRPVWRRKFSCPILLEPHEVPPHPVKLYFLLICPQLLQLFLIKPVSLIKIYLKLWINLSYQIKLIFSKNWIILLKCLTRKYHQKKISKYKINDSIIYKFVYNKDKRKC